MTESSSPNTDKAPTPARASKAAATAEGSAPGVGDGQEQTVAPVADDPAPAVDDSATPEVTHSDGEPVAYVSTDTNGAVTYAANPDLPTGEDTAPSGQTDETDVLVVISSNWIDSLSLQVEGYPEAFVLTPRGVRVPKDAVTSIIEQAAAESVVVSTKG